MAMPGAALDILLPVVGQLLLGGPPPLPKPDVVWDPSLPTGADLQIADRPHADGLKMCSFRHPVCVHGLAGAEPGQVLRALDDLEVAYEKLVLVLGLPGPKTDGVLGGSGALDLYLDPTSGPHLETRYDLVPSLGFDSASAFCRTGPQLGWAMERAAALCVGEAIAARLDASTAPDVRRAYATSLWWALGEPTAIDLQAIDDAASHPEAALFSRDLRSLSEGPGALFFTFLDARRGQGRVGWLSTALLAAAAGETPRDSLTWHNEPDLFDVLRHTVDENAGGLARLLGDFAVARGFLGARDDGTHWRDLGWTGEAGRVRFDWELQSSSLPRRVASVYPVDPNGALYVWLDLDDKELGTTLGFQAEWEPPVSFQWNLVRVAKDGRELSRLVVPFQERATEVTQTITNLEAASGLLIVGTQLGGLDPLHPFDPDLAPFEPHACTIYVTKL